MLAQLCGAEPTKDLNLSYQGLGDADGLCVAAAIRSNTVLTQLDLSSNQFGEDTWQAVANVVRSNSTLKVLSLHSSKLPLAKLRGTDPVEKLNLSCQGLLDPDGLCIAAAIAGNKALRE